MNAVGPDEHVAARGMAMGAVAIKEICGDAAVVLGERSQPAVQMNARFAKPGAHRLIDHALQPAAMDRELREFIAGVQPAGLAPDLLAEPVGVEKLVSADRNRIEALEQSKLGQFLDGMRQRVDADAKLADRVRLLEDFALDPARMKHQRRYQAADAAAGDDHLHKTLPQPTRVITDSQSAAGGEKCNLLPSGWL